MINRIFCFSSELEKKYNVLTASPQLKASAFAVTDDQRLIMVSYLVNSSGGELFMPYPAQMAIQIQKINKYGEILSNPENVAKIIASKEKIPNIVIREIFNIYKIKDKKNCLKIKCDYRYKFSETIYKNKTIYIYKTYNCFDDLLKIIEIHNKYI